MEAWDKATYRYDLDTVAVDTDQRAGGIRIIPVNNCVQQSFAQRRRRIPEFDAFFLVNCLNLGAFFQAVPLFLVPFVMGKLSNNR